MASVYNAAEMDPRPMMVMEEPHPGVAGVPSGGGECAVDRGREREL